MSVINLGNSVRDFTKSEEKAFTNVELVVDDSASVKARASGSVIPNINGWKVFSSRSDAVATVSPDSIRMSCGSAMTDWQLSVWSNPSSVLYRQLVGRTVKVSFTVNGVGSGWRVYVNPDVRNNKVADKTRLYYKNYYVSSNGSHTYSFEVGGDWFKTDYADGWFGIELWLYSTSMCNIVVTNIAVTVDDDSQTTLVGNCPWATQTISEQVLSKLSNFSYRPFDALGARLTPAAELGDNVIIDGSGYSLVSQDAVFGSEFVSNIAAPYDEELDHEFEYVPPDERRFRREIRTLRAELDIQADAIEAKVASVGGNQNSFGWRLEQNNFIVYASGSEVLKVTRNGAEIRGTVYATAGEIGGCKIVNGKLQIASANIGSINAEQITAGYLDVSRIKTGSITSLELHENSVTNYQLNTDAVQAYNISGGAVTTPKIYGGAVTTAKISDGAVTMSKLSSDSRNIIGSAAKLFGNSSDYGSKPSLYSPYLKNATIYGSTTFWPDGSRKYVLGVFDTKPASGKYVCAIPI